MALEVCQLRALEESRLMKMRSRVGSGTFPYVRSCGHMYRQARTVVELDDVPVARMRFCSPQGTQSSQSDRHSSAR